MTRWSARRRSSPPRATGGQGAQSRLHRRDRHARGRGASTLATSLACFATDHKHPTALLDLDIHFGTGALALDLEPGRGLTDAIETPAASTACSSNAP
jgi:pilus assembly protein CpaE